MNRRRFMMMQTQHESLPEGYTAVDYLQTSGEQYIDTGIVGSSSVGVFADFCFTDFQKNQSFMQVYDQTEGYQCLLLKTSAYDAPNSNYWFICGYINASVYFKEADADRHKYYFNADGKQSIEMDGVSYGKADPSKTNFTAGARTLYLFARNALYRNQTLYTNERAYMKLYSCAIFDRGVKVRNFVPCLDPNGKPCMYDSVSKTAFYNQGDGQFTWGD